MPHTYSNLSIVSQLEPQSPQNYNLYHPNMGRMEDQVFEFHMINIKVPQLTMAPDVLTCAN